MRKSNLKKINKNTNHKKRWKSKSRKRKAKPYLIKQNPNKNLPTLTRNNQKIKVTLKASSRRNLILSPQIRSKRVEKRNPKIPNNNTNKTSNRPKKRPNRFRIKEMTQILKIPRLEKKKLNLNKPLINTNVRWCSTIMNHKTLATLRFKTNKRVGILFSSTRPLKFNLKKTKRIRIHRTMLKIRKTKLRMFKVAISILQAKIKTQR